MINLEGGIFILTTVEYSRAGPSQTGSISDEIQTLTVG